jgi:hypothetical protein
MHDFSKCLLPIRFLQIEDEAFRVEKLRKPHVDSSCGVRKISHILDSFPAEVSPWWAEDI